MFGILGRLKLVMGMIRINKYDNDGCFWQYEKTFFIMNDQSIIQDLKSFVMISWCDMFSMSVNKCNTALFG